MLSGTVSSLIVLLIVMLIKRSAQERGAVLMMCVSSHKSKYNEFERTCVSEVHLCNMLLNLLGFIILVKQY